MGKPEPINIHYKHRYQHSKFPPGTRVLIAECIDSIYPEAKDIAGKTVRASFGWCDVYNGQCGHSHDFFVPVFDEETRRSYKVEQNFVFFAEEK